MSSHPSSTRPTGHGAVGGAPAVSTRVGGTARPASIGAPMEGVSDAPHAPVAAGFEYDRTGAHEKGVQRFIQATYELVSVARTDYCVSWAADGKSFVLTDYDAVAATELGNFFASSNIASFIRQLNMYSFRKRGEKGHWEYSHPYFLRGRTDLLRFIQRQKKKSAKARSRVPSATSSGRSSPTAPAPAVSASDAAQVRSLQADLARMRSSLRSCQHLMAERDAQVAALQGQISTMRASFSAVLADQSDLFAQFASIQSLVESAFAPPNAAGKRKRAPVHPAPSPPALADLFPGMSPRVQPIPIPAPSPSAAALNAPQPVAHPRNPKPFPPVAPPAKRHKPLATATATSTGPSVALPPRNPAPHAPLSLTPSPPHPAAAFPAGTTDSPLVFDGYSFPAFTPPADSPATIFHALPLGALGSLGALVGSLDS